MTKIDANLLGGFQDLTDYWGKLSQLESALYQFQESAYEFTKEPIERALEKIHSFEPSVSVIGQVKAGKSTLMNAMIGQVDLLPIGVNPWTSVITAVHLNSRMRPKDTRALFRFFDSHEWERLSATGGRLGEMASRAGFDSEAESVKEQVMQMRAATEARLGSDFESLLGSSHVYPEVEKSVIDRYICYGDPEDLAGGSEEGVYADITKNADLYLDLPGYPAGLCLRDTPGVNDTFMMREQITLNAISESRACVVVLSAHQALSTMDMALLRIICAVDAREVIIFVNRIDELRDPVGDCQKIRASITKTLERMGMGDGIEIQFGSGYWARCALSGDLDGMLPASRRSLDLWVDAHGSVGGDLTKVAFEASGVPGLHRGIAKRIVEGPGQLMLRDIKQDVDNIVQMSETISNINEQQTTAAPDIDREEMFGRVAKLRDEALTQFDSDVAAERESLEKRLRRAQMSFLDSAIETLASHVDVFGERDSWRHEPTGLRMMMRTAYMAAGTQLRRACESRIDGVVEGVQDLVEIDLGIFGADNQNDVPRLPECRAPTGLARTLSLDLNQSWWQRFSRSKGVDHLRAKYSDLIMRETEPLIDEVLSKSFDPHAQKLREAIIELAGDQHSFVEAIFDSLDANAKATGGDPERSVA